MKNAVLCLSVVIIPAFLATARSISPPAQMEHGKALFKTRCQVCHINKAEGDRPFAYTLQFWPDDFSDPDTWKHLDRGDIQAAIKKGHGAMPPQNLKPDEIDAVSDYLIKTYKPN